MNNKNNFMIFLYMLLIVAVQTTIKQITLIKLTGCICIMYVISPLFGKFSYFI